MVNISNFGNLPPPGRLGRITPSSGWNHVGEDELFDATLSGPRFREPFGIAGRPDAGEPLEFDMVADEVLFGAEMMVTDGHLALLSKLPGTSRQGRLPQKVYKYQDRFMVQAIPSSGDQRGGGNGRQGKPNPQSGQASLDY
jgi:hypothetical protein